MKAIVFDSKVSVRDVSVPVPAADETLIRVAWAGICTTDLEITRGYVAGFRGILGHEFWGYAEGEPGFDRARVTAEINCVCGTCDYCGRGLGRHCPNRTVIGIVNRPGAFAGYIAVPRSNLVVIPPEIPDSSAIFIEPLAAALEILEQVEITAQHSVLVVGDGRLAQLIARVLHTTGCGLTVVGKHEWKLGLLRDDGIRATPLCEFTPGWYDMVIEASGSPSGFELALSCVKPRGTLVLKSTYASSFNFNPAGVVVNEVTIVGSRCGRFSEAVKFLRRHKPDLSRLITGTFDLDSAEHAFAASTGPRAMKVLLKCG